MAASSKTVRSTWGWMMGFTALRCGGGLSGIFLKDGARMIGARSEIVDDFARRAVKSAARKIFAAAEKNFSAMTFDFPDREVSVWDFHCHGCFRNGRTFRDRMVADFMRLALVQWIDGMSEEMRWLIEMSASNRAAVEDDEALSREIVLAVVLDEVNYLVRQRGQSLQMLYAGAPTPHQPMMKGASPR